MYVALDFCFTSRIHEKWYEVSRDANSRSSWNTYPNGELSQKVDLDDDSSFGVATPFLKSFMQVGSRFGESTFKLGSILFDGQVGIFKDRSAAAVSTFDDTLPVQAAGLLSSFTATRSDWERGMWKSRGWERWCLSWARKNQIRLANFRGINKQLCIIDDMIRQIRM